VTSDKQKEKKVFAFLAIEKMISDAQSGPGITIIIFYFIAAGLPPSHTQSNLFIVDRQPPLDGKKRIKSGECSLSPFGLLV